MGPAGPGLPLLPRLPASPLSPCKIQTYRTPLVWISLAYIICRVHRNDYDRRRDEVCDLMRMSCRWMGFESWFYRK